MRFHPLTTDLDKPKRFTYPFGYEPHPLAVLAAEEVQREIGRMQADKEAMAEMSCMQTDKEAMTEMNSMQADSEQPKADQHIEGKQVEDGLSTEGKMYGVLVVETSDGELGFLAAYSGLLEGRNDWDYFVPPVFDAQQPEGHFKQTEREITELNKEIRRTDHTTERNEEIRRTDHTTERNKEIRSTDHTTERNEEIRRTDHTLLKIRRKQLSEELQLWLFHQYQFLNGRGEKRDLVDVWQDYHCSPRIRSRYPLPPGGTGDCCAPKLLQYAYQHQLKPVCMAEFWWGPSPKSEIRHHGQYYPACRGKCKPVLTWMLQGLDVDPNPEEQPSQHQEPEIVYEDEAIAVVYKPAGMLSVPGRTADHSVASWAEKRWPGAMMVHRLDMCTSGLIIAAKTPEAYHHLQQQFEQRTVRKKYLAIVEGIVKQEHGIIDLPLASDPMNRPRQIVDHEHGKRAITEYRLLAATENRSLLALYPHTGRTHQLRMHCAHAEGLGYPILGDELYGRKADRLYLQAQAITLVHPTTGKKMHFELPYPFGKLIPFNNK